MRRGRARFFAGALVAGALIAGALLLFAFSPAPARAATGAGRIFGYLLNGTKNDIPVARQQVTVQVMQGNTIRDLTSNTTDAQGVFTFGGLETKNAIGYVISTRYQGVRYATDRIDLSSKPVQQVNLTVYEATASPAGIGTDQAIVVLDQPGNEPGLLTVSEYFFLRNPGTRTFVGSLSSGRSSPNALRFSLPPGARALSPGEGFGGSQIVAVNGGFVTSAALPPGLSRFALSFEVPYTTSAYDFRFAVVYPTTQLSLLVPAQLQASSVALSSLGLLFINQSPNQLFKAINLHAGVEIQLQIAGLPAPQPASSASTLNQGLLWVLVGLLLLLALLSAAWSLRRSAGSPSPALQQTPGNEYDRKQSEQVQTSTSEDRQQRLFQELLDLDKAFEAGTLPKAVYKERRAKTKARLRTLLDGGQAAHAIEKGLKEGV